MGGLLVPVGVWRNPMAVLLPESALQQDRQQGDVPLLWRRCHCPHHDRPVFENTTANDQPFTVGPSVLFGAIAKNTNWEAAGYSCGAPSDECNEDDLGYPVCTDKTPTKVDQTG